MTLYYTANKEPHNLPFRTTTADGYTRTDLPSLSNAELADLGYYPAPTKPDYDPYTQHLEWDAQAEDWSVESGGEKTPPYELSVTLDKEVITADGSDTVTVTIQLKLNDSLVSDQDGKTWYVPVLGVDGVQRDLLKVVLSGGEATATWSTTQRGIYTVRLDKIRPQTSASLSSNPEVIAE